MSVATTGIGLRRLQHLVLWVSDVERSTRFYCDVLGFAVQRTYAGAVFLAIPGSNDDHNLGLFEQTGLARPHEGVARMYHSAWEVGEITDLVRARHRLFEAGALVGSSDHGVALRQGSRRPRVRALLDRPRRRARQDPPVEPRGRARAPRPGGPLATRPRPGSSGSG